MSSYIDVRAIAFLTSRSDVSAGHSDVTIGLGPTSLDVRDTTFLMSRSDVSVDHSDVIVV